MSGEVGVDKKQVTDKAAEYGLVVSAAALDRIVELGLDYEGAFQKARDSGDWFINPGYLEEEDGGGGVVCETPDVDLESAEVVKTRKPAACDIESLLEIHDDGEVTGKSTCSGQVEDFINYFNGRYDNLKSVIQEHVEYRSPISIEQLRREARGERARIICMVSDKRESSKGYRFLDVEDPTGELTVLVSDRDRRLVEAYDRILYDEVIGLEGVLKGDLFIASDITQPDIPLNHPRRYADEEVYAVFLSDTHVGSYLFLEKQFQSFIDWLNGRGNRREIANSVKYVFIAGDLVDGIGIYPQQEKELTIPDISRQYEFLSLLLGEIPDHIEVVAGMGNHDAVRNAEPQPRIAREIAGSLYELPNVHVVGNPARFSAHGVEFLMYHGTSLDTIIGSLSGSTYSRPEAAMMEYLRRRHLVPTYGSDSISPEEKDYLFIKDVPDVFHCGHVHTNGYAQYRGVNVINSGTWQAKTEYQERLGHQPTPCLVPVMNLQNHEVMMLDFSGNGH